MDSLYIIQILPFIIGLIVSSIVLVNMRLISSNGALIPGVRDKKIPTNGVEIGGVAIFPIMLIAMCVALGIPHFMGFTELSEQMVLPSALRILQVIAGCAMLYIVGLKNDMNGTGGKVKFLAVLVSSCCFPATGLWIQDLGGLFGLHEIPAYIGMPFTVLFAMFLIEMISFMDDIDGLGAGLFCITSAIFLAFCVVTDFVLGSIVSAAALGVIVPFSVLKSFYAKWKKTLLGNAANYVLGYILAYMTLALFRQSGHTMPLGMQMVCFGILLFPAIDALRVLRLRVREGRDMLEQDRNQMQHRLQRTGIPHRLVPIAISFILLLFAAVNTWWVFNIEDHLTWLFFVDILMFVIIQTLISYAIHRNETLHHQEKWEMQYGREAWEADTPIDTIKQKHKNFGTMGLPKHVILGDELDFIPDGMNGFERQVKRVIDMLFSAFLIVVFSPLFLLSYILIKLDDGGPAIYSQERIGRFGRPFYIHKFRSMRLDAEKAGPALSHGGGDDDPRLTKVGKFLRAHHLDELPQLWDVCCGNMAFIGPRPERMYFINQIMEHDPRYSFLYQIRPGVTSYATLYNGYTDTMEKMLRRLSYDLYYLEHRSWWLDMKILWLTFVSIVSGKKF